MAKPYNPGNKSDHQVSTLCLPLPLMTKVFHLFVLLLYPIKGSHSSMPNSPKYTLLSENRGKAIQNNFRDSCKSWSSFQNLTSKKIMNYLMQYATHKGCGNSLVQQWTSVWKQAIRHPVKVQKWINLLKLDPKCNMLSPPMKSRVFTKKFNDRLWPWSLS